MRLTHTENLANESKAKVNFALAVRIITLSPVLAAMLMVCVFALSDYVNGVGLVMGLIFLTVLPLLSYPVSASVPALKKTGRKGQRYFAIAVSLFGYVAGVIYACFFRQSNVELAIYLTYLISGVLIALCSFVFKFQASGHAAGIAGPIAFLTYLFGASFLWLIVLFVLSLVAALIMKRHTVIQFFGGALCPIVAMTISLLIVSVL